jgi:hypothetical protein
MDIASSIVRLAAYLIDLRHSVSPPGGMPRKPSLRRALAYHIGRKQSVSIGAPETLAECFYLIGIVVPYGPTKETSASFAIRAS